MAPERWVPAAGRMKGCEAGMREGTQLRTPGGSAPIVHGPGLDGALVEVARAAAAEGRGRGGEGGWGVAVAGFWRTAGPPEQAVPVWKSHALTAIREKFRGANSWNGTRESGGEYVLVSPAGQFRWSGGELPRAGVGACGSGADHPCLPGSVDPVEGKGSTAPASRGKARPYIPHTAREFTRCRAEVVSR